MQFEKSSQSNCGGLALNNGFFLGGKFTMRKSIIILAKTLKKSFNILK